MPITTLILDGIWGRKGRFDRMRQAIEAGCGPAEVFPYDCSGTGCLQSEGERLAADIRRRRSPVNVVAFSMGGLVARAAHAAEPALPLQRAVFLNTPHRGSFWCYFAWPFSSLRSLHQMRPNSEFLARLAAMTWSIPTLLTWCPFDLPVFPGSRANWKGASAQRIRCTVPLHEWPIFSASIRSEVVSFLSGRGDS